MPVWPRGLTSDGLRACRNGFIKTPHCLKNVGPPTCLYSFIVKNNRDSLTGNKKIKNNILKIDIFVTQGICEGLWKCNFYRPLDAAGTDEVVYAGQGDGTG